MLVGDAGKDATVFQLERCGAVGVRNLGVRIENVVQEVVEVGAIRAGEVGADLAARAEERVARGASAVEDRAATGGVGFGEGFVFDERFVFLPRGDFVGGAFAGDAPEFFELRVEGWIVEAANLAGDGGGKIARGDALGGDGGEQRLREGRA